MTPTEFMREYESSGRTGGVERTLGLIDDKAIYWFSDGSSHVGKSAIERAIRRNLEAIKDETYRISEIVWVAQSADVAACVYRFDWSGLIGGAPASGFGRGTSVLARRGEAWVVVHEHLSKGQTR
jgi:ketosteroid isomerase-like protein